MILSKQILLSKCCKWYCIFLLAWSVEFSGLFPKGVSTTWHNPKSSFCFDTFLDLSFLSKHVGVISITVYAEGI